MIPGQNLVGIGDVFVVNRGVYQCRHHVKQEGNQRVESENRQKDPDQHSEREHDGENDLPRGGVGDFLDFRRVFGDPGARHHPEGKDQNQDDLDRIVKEFLYVDRGAGDRTVDFHTEFLTECAEIVPKSGRFLGLRQSADRLGLVGL